MSMVMHNKNKDRPWQRVAPCRRQYGSWLQGPASSHPCYDFAQKHGATLVQLRRRMSWCVSRRQANRWYDQLWWYKRQLDKEDQTHGPAQG